MSPALRELDHRSNDGIDVRLLWSEPEHTVLVVVFDAKRDERFEVVVHDGESPLDVFHHPYAYAAWRKIDPRMRRAAQAA